MLERCRLYSFFPFLLSFYFLYAPFTYHLPIYLLVRSTTVVAFLFESTAGHISKDCGRANNVW
ncbi:hypothetical protein BCR43DRAFT_498351 [Syncephalastrum racemosum]|uniref:Uncharacterized protein n=1 Tax=Syncephalastrum racemosum TaxID=13706 RepID=A0A1X2H0R7_SYNRA|nr:hypothetical protein BCR43DRAFT_498351 [Syncephalastrum racemosum]